MKIRQKRGILRLPTLINTFVRYSLACGALMLAFAYVWHRSHATLEQDRGYCCLSKANHRVVRAEAGGARAGLERPCLAPAVLMRRAPTLVTL